MSRFRTLKLTLRSWLLRPEWTKDQALPPQIAAGLSLTTEQKSFAHGKNFNLLSLVNPLFACLPEEAPLSDRAAFALGNLISRIYAQNREEARNIIRRFIWQMNVESGNIGWGIPKAFGQTLAQNHALAQEYHKVLFHYIYNKKGDNSYCDYAPLRQSCYTALADVVRAWPEYAKLATALLQQAAKTDDDQICRQQVNSLLIEFKPLAKSQPEKA